MEHKGMARTIMVLLMVIATLFGSHRSMTKLVHSATTVFYEGVDGDGLGIDHDLNERINLAFNLTTIARSYIGDDEIDSVLQARQELVDAKTVEEKYKANVRLTETTTKLYQMLENHELSESHASYRKRIHADLQSRNATISHDGYNEAAREVNATLNGIPAKWLRMIVRIPDVPLFR